jgi:hypothetical protein
MTPDALPRDYDALAARLHAAATPPVSLRIVGQQTSAGGAGRDDLLLLRVPAAGAPRWRVYLNGGTHGDEPAGAEAVTRFLEARHYQAWPDVSFTLTPCLNPWGYRHNRREGPGGRDLNRSFRRAGPATQEVGLIKRALRRQAFDLFLDCHEDVDTPGLYVFAPEVLGRAIVDAVRPVGPVHPGPLVDGEIPLKDSVVVLDSPERSRERPRTWSTWPLPFYVGRYHHRARQAVQASRARQERTPEGGNLEPPDLADIGRMTTATIETPTSLGMDQRVALHHAAIDAALRLLTTGRLGAA